MALTRIINKFFLFLYYLLRFRHPKLAFQFSHYRVPLKLVKAVKRKGGNLLFTNTGNQVPIEQVYKYKQESAGFIKVLNHRNISVVSVSKDTFVVEVNGLRLTVQSLDNIIVINEVFIEKIYALSTPANDNVIVDIGMNVGYASLFFASLKNVAQVYSFEPFPQTFDEAIANIDLNTSVKNKIAPSRYGISNYSGSIDVPMAGSGSASASTDSAVIEYNKALATSVTIPVKLKSVDELVDEVFGSHPHQNIYFKIDCEGEEYAIMDSLSKNRHMKNIAGFFIEWHVKGASSIIQALTDNQFLVVELPNTEAESGMLYAFKEPVKS